MRLTRRRGLLTLARWNARLFPKGELALLPTGNTLFIPPNPHFIGYALARHEHHITRLMQERIRPGDLCVDVGANIGYFTAIMAALSAPGGLVVALEPEPANFGTLSINARLAMRLGSAIRVLHVAASSTSGRIRLVRGRESTLHQVESGPAAGLDGECVDCVRLDSIEGLCERRIAFLKIDVEGHEVSVLEGARRLFESGQVVTAVVEITPGACAAQVEALLGPLRPTKRCWIEGGWRETSLRELTSRTDVFMEFHPQQRSAT